MTKEDRRYRDRFDPSVDVNMLENPLIPRQSENAAWLLDQRYLLSRYDRAEGKVRKEASFEEFARRVSRVIASVETLYVGEDDLNWIRVLEKNLFSDILNRRFLFNSPCLFGAAAGMTVDPAMSELIYRSPDDMSYSDYVAVRDGKTESQQLFACFVISVEDSIEGIFDSVKDAAVISKYGGGVGGNFGNLREFGSDIKGGTGGKASGPVSFMETWNTMGSVVVQGGRRRAALMGMLYDDHPDVERFMDAKVEDGKLPYFNISVSVSDELLTKAAQGGDFHLRSRADGSVAKTVKAADLWDKLCRNAWRRGDPGVFFGDRANVDNILKKDPQWRIESTNPCVTGDTWVMTDEGPKQAVNLVGRPTTLLVDGKGHETEGFFSTGVKPVFELKTKEGHSLKLTADHKVMVDTDGEWSWIPAGELSEGNILRLHDHSGEGKISKVMFDSLVPCGEEEVFDVQVPGVNAFDANGLYVHNCGEQPLPNYTSCNLGSVNLEAFVSSESSGEAVFDMDSFVDQVFRSVYYLDLVIDATSYPLERIAERTKMIRPVGLGLMGLADAAIMLGISYGSESFNRFCRSLGGTMASAALAATVRIVSEEGKDPFPEHRLVSDLMESFRCEAGLPDAVDRWLERMDEGGFRELLERMRRTDTVPYTLVNTLEALLSAASVHRGDGMGLVREVLEALFSGRMRTSRRLSVAPTGSISMLLDASPGIEPNFAWSWSRKVMSATGDGGYETREYFHRLMTAEHKDEFRRTGGISDPRFVTAYDIGTDSHVEVTGIFAAVVDSGISKTVNLPSEATVDDVRQVYEDCYRMGCKGITIYRDGSRSDQPIEAKKSDEPEKRPLSSKVKERPGSIVFGKTIKDVTPWGSMYVTINYDGDDPFEVFASLGKSGSEMKSMTEALSRVISIGLRSGGRLEDFISTLRGISGKEYWLFECDDDRVVRSIPDGIAILMEKLSGLGGETLKNVPKCPECGSPMEMVGGCEYCFSCGYSPCK
ncbi:MULTISPECIES: TSCPD domain-containing protein [Dethiosulfovibrio]|uniref:Vitamin B12-dependent ribonucleotide reductase n=2 Tax=Dethiosulfovibrio TaxID=47054 RepID=A0ABS9ELU9_9BACT|nr:MULTISPECIES: ribonucleoside-diphosphate reductase [Dethiosulfovibrio]MCF4113113.1 ribonucleoside-diphosphate reductase [Dethiosulfovibrio russensis]MCF4142177.1 ribonucleoside-diphosphate reductase [Dethiosulfovibrio marinus]MCF4145842.1 ribonucleoside-diphosphate reductase [Dethiosulfovibrio acidaminovorans]